MSFQIVMRIICGLSFLWLVAAAGPTAMTSSALDASFYQCIAATALFSLSAWLGGLMG